MAIIPDKIRREFSALSSGAVFFDGPGGTQVPERVVDRMTHYLIDTNANESGAFATSQASDATVLEARQAMADFFNAKRPDEIVFGSNMTSLTLATSRALARDLVSGDEIIVTRLDHDANIAPWLLIAEDRDCTVRWVDIDVEDCTLCLDQLVGLLSERTRLVAVGYASNATGTINPVRRIVEHAHEVGALCYLDAVHYSPHGVLDVQALGCDFAVVSAYKFFGPHVGILYGRYPLLDRLEAYNVRPAPTDLPGKFETGTGNYEGIAGVLGAVEYLEDLGHKRALENGEPLVKDSVKRRQRLQIAMENIRAYELRLVKSLLETLGTVPGLRIYGITDLDDLELRVPTVSFTIDGLRPRAIAEYLADQAIYVWDGHYYSLELARRLDLADRGGMVRVGLVHYNTFEEIDCLGSALHQITK